MKTHFRLGAAVTVATCLLAPAFAQTSSSSSSQHQPSSHSQQTTSYGQPATPSDSNSKSALDTTSGVASAHESSLKWGDKRFVTKVAESGQLEIALAQLAVERASNADVRAFAQQLVSDHEQMARKLDQLADQKGLREEIAEYTPNSLHATSMTGRADNGSASVTGSTGSYPSGSIAGNSRTPNDTNRGMNANADTPPSAKTSPGSYAIGETAGTVGMTTTGSDWNDPTKDRHYRRLEKKQGAEFDKEFISMMVDDHEDDIALFDRKSKKADDGDVRAFASEALPTLQQHLKEAQRIAATQKS